MSATVQVKSSESSHYYLPDGTPFYEVPNASKPGEMRPTTLRDARKVGAVPSVTTVLNCVRKPGLDRWKIEQAILAALTLPRLPDEPDQAYAARVAEDADETSRKAADFGTRLHDAIEAIVVCEVRDSGYGRMIDIDLKPFVDGFIEWYNANRDSLIGCLVDWKTSSTMKAWPEWAMQMAAYLRTGWVLTECEVRTEVTFANTVLGYGGRVDFISLGMGPLLCKNIIISSSEPGRIEVKEWTHEEIENGWETFKAILKVWQLMNNYFPNRKDA